jgi:hypothetical protein
VAGGHLATGGGAISGVGAVPSPSPSAAKPSLLAWLAAVSLACRPWSLMLGALRADAAMRGFTPNARISPETTLPRTLAQETPDRLFSISCPQTLCG